MEKIKEKIGQDIIHIFNKLEKLRIEEFPWIETEFGNIPDFRPYRSMSYCLVDTFNNYDALNNHNIKNEYFIEWFIEKLTDEIDKLHETMEQNKEGYQQFKCLNDAFIKLTRLLYNVNKDIEYGKTLQKGINGNKVK